MASIKNWFLINWKSKVIFPATKKTFLHGNYAFSTMLNSKTLKLKKNMIVRLIR
jgi:hypothetical protein